MTELYSDDGVWVDYLQRVGPAADVLSVLGQTEGFQGQVLLLSYLKHQSWDILPSVVDGERLHVPLVDAKDGTQWV